MEASDELAWRATPLLDLFKMPHCSPVLLLLLHDGLGDFLKTSVNSIPPLTTTMDENDLHLPTKKGDPSNLWIEAFTGYVDGSCHKQPAYHIKFVN